ncbi:hypothetical protein BZG36_01429 [Bifiguratus adelaidae]|uniref:Xylanolytic transcriptional activator regulatory domain-containing protein n=1 Tax=Bifiguratus adelaidae TaxID=1938954 RepID=A0A261Y4X9_9FUNG|nr:hypothetical protein BZG36_01429 [Bifiguratus adelaidae]
MKLRCDSVDTFPSPCSRCAKKGTFCEVDRNFTRERKRPQQASPDAMQVPTSLAPRNGALNAPFDIKPTAEGSNTDPSGSATPVDLPTVKNDNVKEYRIGNLSVPSAQVDMMFATFSAQFYPFLPAFPIHHIHPQVLWPDYELLFWAICNISARVCAPELVDVITLHLRSLINTTYTTHYIFRPFTSLTHVYALVLLCHWPLPHQTFQEDVSWTYAGIATHIALQIGLHRSAFTEEYTICKDGSQKYQARALTWLACVLVNQEAANLRGIPSTAAMDNLFLSSLLKVEHEDKNVSEMIKQARLLHALKGGIDKLGCVDSSEAHARHLVHRACEEVLASLLPEMMPWAKMTELVFLQAKLQLHSFLLSPDTPVKDQKDVIVPIYMVCIQTIQVIKSMLDSQKSHQYWPYFVHTSTISAAVALFKLTTCPYRDMIDEDTARNHVTDAYTILKTVTRVNRDVADRGIRLLDALSIMAKQETYSKELCIVKTRLGAGIFATALLEFKKWSRHQARQEKDEMPANGSMGNDIAFETFIELMTVDNLWDWGTWPELETAIPFPLDNGW